MVVPGAGSDTYRDRAAVGSVSLSVMLVLESYRGWADTSLTVMTMAGCSSTVLTVVWRGNPCSPPPLPSPQP